MRETFPPTTPPPAVTVDDGGWAFPCNNAFDSINAGMTLRDWFAGQSPFSIDEAFADWNDRLNQDGTIDEVKPSFMRSRMDPAFLAYFARLEYAYADAMIAARKAPTP